MGDAAYICDDVRAARRLTAEVYDGAWTARPIRETLERHAAALLNAHRGGDPAAAVEIGNCCARLVGRSRAEIRAADFGAVDARETIAREHGFANWAAVEELSDLFPDNAFEAAVDAMVAGEIDAFRELLAANPGLDTAKSAFAHRSTLLHYLAANGVEIRRQSTPYGAVRFAEMLIEAGADVNATAWHYGDWYTTLPLLTSSAHPAEAGVADELAALLREHGAKDRP